MFQKGRLGIVLALLLVVILTLTGCTNSAINKAVKNSKAFADEKNFEQAAQTLHSAERELGSNLGPKELEALAEAYGYIFIKIADNIQTETENGNFEKAFAELNLGNPKVGLPANINLTPEAVNAIDTVRREIAKKCLIKALDGKTEPRDSIQLFNTASKNTSVSITPEIQKIFDDAKIKLTEGLLMSIIKEFEGKNSGVSQNLIAEAEDIIRTFDSMDTSITKVQSDKMAKARELLLMKQTQADIDNRITQAEQAFVPQPNTSGVISVEAMTAILKPIHDDPFYSKLITEEQKQRYNAVVTRYNEMIRAEAAAKWFATPESINKDTLPLFPIQ